MIWAVDRGMTSEENRRNLQRAEGQYILGEKLRGTNIKEEALNRSGRFKVITENLHIKEVFVGEGAGRRLKELKSGKLAVDKARARAELERLHIGEFLHKDGRILQYTEPTQAQRKILKKLKIFTPKRVRSFTGTPKPP